MMNIKNPPDGPVTIISVPAAVAGRTLVQFVMYGYIIVKAI